MAWKFKFFVWKVWSPDEHFNVELIDEDVETRRHNETCKINLYYSRGKWERNLEPLHSGYPFLHLHAMKYQSKRKRDKKGLQIDKQIDWLVNCPEWCNNQWGSKYHENWPHYQLIQPVIVNRNLKVSIIFGILSSLKFFQSFGFCSKAIQR